MTDVVRARSLSLLLDDCSKDVAAAPMLLLRDLAESIADESGRRADHTELAELAAAILGDAGFGGDAASGRTARCFIAISA